MAPGRLGPFESVDVDGYEIVKVPILTRDTLGAIADREGFAFEEWNILEPLPERAHVVRAMNILTQDHFRDEQRSRTVANCVEAVLPGGLFIVGWSPTPEPDTVEASIYLVDDGKLIRFASLNGGSEIHSLVARIFPVTDAAGGAPNRLRADSGWS
jgi:hypothetical protein